jgi:hypothetical protein
LIPKIIEDKVRSRRTLTEILGYTLDEDVSRLIKLLNEADKFAENISMK